MNQIVINSQTADVSSDLSVSLQYKSNLFSEVDKLSLNYSLTVSLPITIRNRAIFGMAGVNSQSDAPRKRMKAQLFMDGVMVLDGVCYLTEVTETAYNVCFLWGLDQIEGLKEAGNIEDMDLGAFTMAGQPDASGNLPIKYSAYDSAMVSDAPFFAQTEGGQGVANEDGSFPVECVPAPFIRALWLFDLIMQSNGVAYKMDASAMYDLRHLVIPICGREVDEDDFSLSSTGVGTFNNPSNRATFTSSKGVEFLASDAAKQIAVLSGAVPTGSAMSKPNSYEIGFSGSGSADVTITGKATIPAHRYQFTLRVCVDAYVYDESKGWGEKVTFSEHAKDRIIRSNKDVEMVIDWSVTIPLEFEYANNYILFRVYAKSVDGSFPGATLSSMSFAFTGVSVENAGYKSTIDIAKNIPNMKQIDFIKTVCNVLGVFAMPPANGSDVIRFVRADVFRADEAQDWSGYLVSGGDSMQFTFGDLAQKNIITFKERSDDGEPTTAYFEVSNENIEKESTYLELPLTELAGGRFKLFTKEVKDDGTIEYNRENLDDVFMFLADQGGTAFATWQGMATRDILKRFDDFADLVKAPVVVKRRFLLSPVILKNVDFCKPVYLRQTGCFYGIISISAGGELATVELLQMDL